MVSAQGAGSPVVEPSADSSVSRQRLLVAAVDCILEKGYYRASSNEIARRADVTWGVIQYHFRTRDRLMLAVFEDACQKLIDHSRNAEIVGSTVHEQLFSYFDYLMGFYGQPEYLAYLEISLNLARDPNTSAETMNGFRRVRDEFTEHQINAPAVDPRYRTLVFESLRGLILSHLLRFDGSLTVQVDDRAEFDARARALIEGLAAFVGSGSGASI
jgi:TetR/AcrR family transcriptional regulator, regulator of cefoperazone and chloramphenicol sensitivity